MLERSVLERVIAQALGYGADFVELFLEDRFSTSMKMVNGVLENSSSGRIRGIGIRGFFEDRAIYAYTNDLDEENLLQSATRVGEALRATPTQPGELTLTQDSQGKPHAFFQVFTTVNKKDKVALLRLTTEAAQGYSSAISQVVSTYMDQDQKVWIANSEGLYTEDRRLRTRLTVNAVASDGSQKETGFESDGGSAGFEFYNGVDTKALGEEAARIAVRMLRADFAPAGRMPVVISNGFGGVIFHEACGHPLEATSVAIGASVYSNMIGKRVANECVSAVDDGSIPNAWGSGRIDDEGNLTRRNLLIEKGILKSYLVDRFNGRKMGVEANGCGRRQDYTYAPTSRMSNTVILPGEYIPEEIIAATDHGLYAKKMGGGSVMPTTGEFNFSVREGYMIEKGRVTRPVRGATLIGKGHEILHKIDMVANDLERARGMCGSLSGSIPADVGQPTLRVTDIVVGGRNQ
ncbi:MAG TPA: TldD/PmbA family protein [Thermotogota bacterium]|nr:TldD/PmbA family protein [Thermotogota bacterium]